MLSKPHIWLPTIPPCFVTILLHKTGLPNHNHILLHKTSIHVLLCGLRIPQNPDHGRGAPPPKNRARALRYRHALSMASTTRLVCHVRCQEGVHAACHEGINVVFRVWVHPGGGRGSFAAAGGGRGGGQGGPALEADDVTIADVIR